MRSEFKWSDPGLPPRDGLKSSVYEICFSPDGELMLVAMANLVLLYQTRDGDLRHRLRAHKDTVYSVNFSADGTRFASGGADANVIVWSAQGEGLFKYPHSESVQVVRYNPVGEQLVSCATVDFGLWSKEQKAVTKHKVESKIMCASWTPSGMLLALGLMDGTISIRDQFGTEKAANQRSAPIWCLKWSPKIDETNEILVVGCWDQTLSFYQSNATQTNKDRKLGFYPNSVDFLLNGEYILIGGSDRKATLCSKEAIRLFTVTEGDDWMWSVAAHPNQPIISVGSFNGSINCFEIKFEEVNNLHGDRFAYREHVTDVIVQHLLTEQKVRIKCRDFVKKIAIFKDRLAVLLSDRIHIYELAHRMDPFDMHYRIRKEKIYYSENCSLMTVLTAHILICNENKIQLLSFLGVKEREWIIDSEVTCLNVIGGFPTKESVLFGLKNGYVIKIFIDNSFLIEVIKHSNSIKSIDLSLYKRKLAIVDDQSRIVVYNLTTKDIIFQDALANSVRFNREIEDLICYNTNDSICVQLNNFPVQTYPCVSTSLLSFQGSKLFYNNNNNILQSIDIPQNSFMFQFIESNQLKEAYEVACLGVTESDWRMLANHTTRILQFDIARKAFIRLKDMTSLQMLNSLEDNKNQIIASRQKDSNAVEIYLQAEVLAAIGNYQESAKMLSRIGEVDRAVGMFIDLRRWEDAKTFAANSKTIDSKELMRKQAEWAEEINDWRSASELYFTSGEVIKALKIIGDTKGEGWQNVMIQYARNLSLKDIEALELCANYFLENDNNDNFAREILIKIGDINNLMSLYIRKQQWDAAVKLAQEHDGKFDRSVFVPYAEWLALQDRFDEALDAFRKANRPDQAHKMLQQLTMNSVIQEKYKDASYYYWLLAVEVLKSGVDEPENFTNISNKYQDYMRKADLYYAYHYIYEYSNMPFTTYQPEHLFQTARYVINRLSNEEAPYGISRVRTLHTLAKQGKALGAFKLARFAYEKLQQLCIPNELQEQVEIEMLSLQSKPVRDTAELLPVCYRCGSSNPLLNPATSSFSRGDSCVNCGHPFIRSFINFDILPLVEFVPDDNINDDEAIEYIRAPNESNKSKIRSSSNKVVNNSNGKMVGGANVLTVGNDEDDDMHDEDDLFNKCLNSTLHSQEGATAYIPIVVDIKTLESLRREEVFACFPKVSGGRVTFYKNMLPDIPIALSPPCQRFFHEEDFEFAYLRDGCCPFSRAKDIDDYGHI